MERVASVGLKTDLHIHSKLSSHKDGIRVNSNTIEHLDVLILKLIEHEINICSITDHDAFDYLIYRKLKEEELKTNPIMRVLPGIEFSVSFLQDNVSREVHIVTIFDDTDDRKIKMISNIMELINGKPQYDCANAFSEQKYIEILRTIGVNVVMIAHQKNSLMSGGKSKKNDALALGTDRFNEFLFTDYFEAFEFRNKKNELFNKKYIFENKVDKSLRMITGSDCHQWDVYPKEDEHSNNDYAFTYLKCLPTFRGLVMAVTDYRRIKLENSFFNPTASYLESIKLSIDGQDRFIPLSKGLNAIIGDNSIGKSLLLHALTAFQNTPSNVKKGYEKYLKDVNISIPAQLDNSIVFRFDTQGSVRKLFEDGSFKASEFLRPYFPTDIDPSPYRRIVDEALKDFYEQIQKSFEYDNAKNSLSRIKLLSCESLPQSITFIETIKTENDKQQLALLSALQEVINILNRLQKNTTLESLDSLNVMNMVDVLRTMHEKYQGKHLIFLLMNRIKNEVRTSISSFKRKYNKQITDEQKILSSYYEDISDAIDGIADLVRRHLNIQEHSFEVEKKKISPEVVQVGNYSFVSKLHIEEISSEYINGVIVRVLKKNKRISTSTITQKGLEDILLRYPDESISPLDVLKLKIAEQLDADFSITHSIIQNSMDVYKDLSAGFNSQIYFTLLSGETRNRGIYIIDQPEDHVSQRAIRRHLLEQFKDMSEHRQVIMVTHNPQFIVNLDVDNVIFLTKEDKQSLQVFSGALEYEDDKTNILKIIAENIEGGLETVSKRMKRYEKGL